MWRHRTFQYQSVNSQSGRYTEFAEDEFYVPDEWRRQSISNKQASDGAVDDVSDAALDMSLRSHYERSFKLYQAALELGVAKEQARLFLPGFGVYYTWVLSVNALNLMNFLRLRMAQDAQYEIRVYADAIYTEFFKPMLPWTSSAFEDYVLESSDG